MSDWTDPSPTGASQVKRIDLPVACTLGPHDGLTRLARWKALHALASPVARLEDGVLEVRYQRAPGVQEELESLAAAEQLCCSFVRWVVREDCGESMLRIFAPFGSSDVLAPFATLFAVPVSTKGASPRVGS